MHVNLNVRIDLSTTEDARLIERALVYWIRDKFRYEDLRSPQDADYVLACIEDVEVTVR